MEGVFDCSLFFLEAYWVRRKRLREGLAIQRRLDHFLLGVSEAVLEQEDLVLVQIPLRLSLF